MAAAGNSDFQSSERRSRFSSNPPSWWVPRTGSCRQVPATFANELETTPSGEERNVSEDNPLPPTPAALSISGFSPHADGFADMMRTPCVLRSQKGQLPVRIQQVFRTKTSIYVHSSIENDGRSAYHVTAPDFFELQAGQSTLSLPSFAHKQLDPRLLQNRSDFHRCRYLSSMLRPIPRTSPAASQPRRLWRFARI